MVIGTFLRKYIWRRISKLIENVNGYAIDKNSRRGESLTDIFSRRIHERRRLCADLSAVVVPVAKGLVYCMSGKNRIYFTGRQGAVNSYAPNLYGG
jgi:hypothetical protein